MISVIAESSTSWPDAVMISGVALAAAIAYAAYRFTGGDGP